MKRRTVEELAVDGIAAYRITKLATHDTILDVPRGMVVKLAYERAPHYADAVARMRVSQLDPSKISDWGPFAVGDSDVPKLATLVTCRWCAGVWVAAGVVAARLIAPRLWHRIAEGAVISAAAALIAGLENE